MKLKAGYAVCSIRNFYNLPCKDCKYYGKECDKFKSKHGGLSPADYHNKLAQQNKITEREDY